MSEQLRPLHIPVAANDPMLEDWIARVRMAVSKDGNGIGPGPNSTIVAQAVRPPFTSLPIMLPGGGINFTNDTERDQVLAVILSSTVVKQST